MGDDSIKKNISKNIGKYREACGMSQKELAQRLGVVPSRISNWETGANCPTIDILFEVCEILNVSINDIYGVYPDSKFVLQYDEQEIIKKYRALDSHGKEMVDFTLSKEYDRAIAERKDQVAEYKKWGEQLHAENLKLLNEVYSPSPVSIDEIVSEMGPETDEWSYQLEQFRNNNVSYINSYTNLHTKAKLQKIVDEERAELNAAHERTDIIPSAEDVQHDNNTMDDSNF